MLDSKDRTKLVRSKSCNDQKKYVETVKMRLNSNLLAESSSEVLRSYRNISSEDFESGFAQKIADTLPIDLQSSDYVASSETVEENLSK